RGRAADRGGPDAQERADQPFADAVHAAGGDLRYELRRVDRQLHGGDEQLVLGAEVVVDQRRVDPGAGRDVTDGGSVVSLLGERLPRGGQDGLAGVLVARAASGTGHGYAVRRRRVAAPPSRASRMQPTTIVTSRHIVVVGLQCSRTWMSAASANARPYPSSRSSLCSGVVSSRSSVPVVRSRSIATLVTRNIAMNGNTPSMMTPTRLKIIGCESKT